MKTKSAAEIPSHDLITKELVKKGLKNDVGPEAKLLSWEVKDFTQKGDNYSSIVTGVLVKFEKDGETAEKSYVAKLNPLRPFNGFTEMMDAMYGREVTVLSDIVNGMSAELEKLKLPPIKTPKLLTYNLEERKQLLLTEDLREGGFKMFDRKKGMDIAHALLVMEELGRFHASSLVFEETLPKKSIPETFGHFEEPWLEEDHPSFKLFNSMIGGRFASASELLNNVRKYEKCVRWINNNTNKAGKLFCECFTSTKPLEVLCHGDCWTNNILFKYDDSGNPIDLRFVDLQCSRKSSPTCDLNYFLYISLTGDTRQENLKLLETTYYLSFLKVLLMAGKEPPFTFHEFEEEMKKQKLFGLLSGMFVLPIVLAEGNEVFDFSNITDDNMEQYLESQKEKFTLSAKRGGAFKDRFLAMFDEMIEENIFDQ